METKTNNAEMLTYRNALILNCWSSDAFDNGGYDVAIIELSESLLEAAKERMTLFTLLKCQHKSLCCLNFDDFVPDFFPLGEELEPITDSEEFAWSSRTVRHSMRIPANLKQPIDTSRMEIQRYGCIWHAVQTRVEAEIWTTQLTIPELVACWEELMAKS